MRARGRRLGPSRFQPFRSFPASCLLPPTSSHFNVFSCPAPPRLRELGPMVSAASLFASQGGSGDEDRGLAEVQFFSRAWGEPVMNSRQRGGALTKPAGIAVSAAFLPHQRADGSRGHLRGSPFPKAGD